MKEKVTFANEFKLNYVRSTANEANGHSTEMLTDNPESHGAEISYDEAGTIEGWVFPDGSKLLSQESYYGTQRYFVVNYTAKEV